MVLRKLVRCQMLESWPMSTKLLICLILWRLFAVFLVQTAHVPDEYWQSLEVAHRAAFGYGHLTWEWGVMIRSYAYPFLISIIYRILAMFSLDTSYILTMTPRLLHAFLVAYADYRFYQWTKSKWMLLVLCLNWYWYYCATRTLINSIETVGTIIALTMFPWENRWRTSYNTNFLWIVGLLCMMRPTMAIVWFPLCMYHICTSAANMRVALLIRYAAIGLTCFTIFVLIDSVCYGTFVITPLKFFQVNVLGGVGDVYGTYHALWYIFIGLPVLLGPCYIPFLVAAWQILQHRIHFQREAILLAVIGWTLAIYSFLSHKEFRFLLPLLPMIIYVSSACTYRLKIRIRENTRKGILAVLMLSNFVPGLYLSLVHQRGTLGVMQILQAEISQAYPEQPTDTLILTPCHATPLYSHLHVNASVRFLTCEPNLGNVANYVDEADRFFADPEAWLDHNYINNTLAVSPIYVIAFDNIENKIARFLRNYNLLAKLFYSHFPESNYGKYVSLYKHAKFDYYEDSGVQTYFLGYPFWYQRTFHRKSVDAR